MLARTHRAIVKPPLGTAQSVRKKKLCPAGRSASNILSFVKSPHTNQETSRKASTGRPHPPASCRSIQLASANPSGWSGTVRVFILGSGRRSADRWQLDVEPANRDDARFPGRWRMTGSVRSAPSPAHFQDPRCGRRNMIFTSTSCCSSCEFRVKIRLMGL